MMNVSPTLGVQRLVGLGRAAAFFLLPALPLLPATPEAGLPKYAFTLPSGRNTVAAMKAAEPCGFKGKVVVLPALPFHLAGDEGEAAVFDDQARALMEAAPEAEVFLHVIAGAGALTGRETEKTIADRVSAFLKRLPLASPTVRGLVVEIEEPPTVTDLYTFGLINLAVGAKGINTGMRLAFVLPPGFTSRHSATVKRLATYADLLGLTYTPGWTKEAEWIASQALNKPLILKVDSAQPAQYLGAALAAGESAVEIVWSQPPDDNALEALCAVNNLLTRFITSDMSPGASGASPFRIEVDGVSPGEDKWFISSANSDAIVVARVDGSPGHPKTGRLHGATAGQFEMQWYDPLTGAKLPAGEIVKTSRSEDQTCACESQYALVAIHKVGGADERVFTSVEVRGKIELTVEEIIARWQQYQAAQRQILDNYMADCFLNLHFEGTNVGPGFDIATQYKQFASRAGIEWDQTGFFVNGVKFNNKREFPLPQIEPEKVMTQPLELKLNEKYEYKLLGTEKVNGVYCYVIGIEPKVTGETLFSGKVWIDGTIYRQVKEYLRQRGEKSNVVSNVETQNFELFADAKGAQFNLIASISAQQLLNAAGRDFVLQKTYKFSAYSINTAEFDAALAAARKSDDPMYRETELGLRRLKKEGDERVLVEQADKRVRAIVGGVLYESTFNFPIPIAGFSVSDFNFKNTGAQLSLFFAGPLLVADLSKQYGTKFRLAVDAAISGLPDNNRVYSGNTELMDQTVWAWNENTGLRATWQATTSLSLTASTYFSYEYYHGNSDTSPLFVLPRDGVTLLPGLELKFAKKGYIFTADVTRGQRLGWRGWGVATQPEPLHDGFTQYQADFNKTAYIGKFTKFGVDFAYAGGNDLDRFSQYVPSYFTLPRIHGFSGGTDRFDAMAIGSVNYGFNILDAVKFEVAYSYARARNIFESPLFKEFDGVDTIFGTTGPFGTYVQGTISYAIDGNIARYNSRWGAYVLIFKPLH
jgi:hypothetical protein